MAILVLAAWGGLGTKLVWIQVVEHGKHVEHAERQYRDELELDGSRGTIYDCRGNVMAIDLPNFYAVGARRDSLPSSRAIRGKIAKILGMSVSRINTRMNSSSLPYVLLARGVDDERAQRLRELRCPGLRLDKQPKRNYPFGTIAGQLLGVTDSDLFGVAGIEYTYESLLHDKPRSVRCWTDALRRIKVAFDDRTPIPKGQDLVLTIDMVAQAIVEEELAAAVQKYRAGWGTAVMTEPKNGRIVAIANYPSFDPNIPETTEVQWQRCRAVTDMIEPGSTFKLIPATAALESGKVAPSKVFDCENGRTVIGRRVFRDAHPHDKLSFREIFALSSNIGMAKIGQELGADLLYHTARDFGIGEPTTVEMDGEARGILHVPAKWSGSSLGNFCIGQGVSVSAIQLAMAYGAVANGGYLLKPQLIQSKVGKVELKPEKIRRVMSRATVDTLKQFMVDVVEYGTGKPAAIDGIDVAGKTGTAQKVDTTNNTYFQNRYVGSFVGFLPADQPQYLLLVIIDDPRGQYYGSVVAAPAFKRIMTRWLAAERSGETTSESSPWVQGEGKESDSQDSDVPENDWLAVQESVITEDTLTVMPSLLGVTIRQAVRELTCRGIEVSASGHGIVKRQVPRPGVALKPGTKIQLTGETNFGETS